MDEVEKKYPDEWKARATDKLKYRFPMGESYIDLVHRIEPIIFAIEKCTEPVIVVSHTAVLRCIYGYFMKRPLKEIPHIEIPLETVIKLNPDAYYNREERFNVEINEKCKTLQDIS